MYLHSPYTPPWIREEQRQSHFTTDDQAARLCVEPTVQDPALRLSRQCDPDPPDTHFPHISPVSAAPGLGVGLYIMARF